MNDSTRRTIRTAFQVTLSVASILLVAVPAALSAAEQTLSPEQYAAVAGVAASIVAVATAVTRAMHSDVVVGLIQTYAPWLSAASAPEAHVEESAGEDFPLDA
ncbi:hypothetical protein FHR83_007116 [Actinoplanes campanulatus]|uniref:Holin n=1 Tax=Actinoplanes campanulatus TaxID=113559 RepID=A0A7W5ANL8_9ACTN|nr:hypothetical protein [Actinoplanes campanulatus]MBB3099410.1 hypothetical protein [Actinoplanes campanulatus]GGN40121.1 hypothetical protein GCM10010109_68760 [Actinoplanes campanulatus]GID42381.1 hypothetical protein Aca09nite_88870 [Actinoplanes campanulatus]